MNFKLKTAAAAMLAASLIACYGLAQEPKAPAKKHIVTKKKKAPAPSVEEQIQSLRQELSTQINGLKTTLAEKDAELKKAQQAAADAQVAAEKAQAAASNQEEAVTANTAGVSTLQSTVNDMKAANASAVASLSDDAAAIKKSISSPGVIHYKGISITPGGFIAAETVYRSKATGGDIPTAFSAIPYEGADAYQLSEFYGSARQSRLSLQADGKTEWGTVRGYYEGDFLGTGITSNNNQSNSYVLRQRVLYAQAETNNHWTFAGGQLWSLSAESKKGITSAPGDIATPQTIDPNYVPGFVWTRQYGFRVVKSFKHSAFGISAENPQLLYSAALANSTPYAVLGSAGANGGNYNAAISTVALTTYVQSYSNVPGYSPTTGATIANSYIPVYNTVAANTNISNISFNQAPDIIVKAAFDPGWGHYEVFGIAGFAHETVYPGVTTNSVKFGGVVDNFGFNGATPGTKIAASTSAGYFTNSIALGGIGGSARVPVIKDKLTVGAKALYGTGTGRYGNSTLSDVTNNAWGGLAPIHNLNGLLTVEVNPTPRLMIYANYGGDYAARADYASLATTLAPSASYCPAGSAATVCTSAGTWGTHFKTPTPTMTAIGYGSKFASVSPTCATVASPGYNSGSATGYQPGGTGCGNNTRSVQEATIGYWYDFYKGDKGRFRQGFQYGYAVREGWSGTGTSGSLSTTLNGAKGIDNMFWTTFRYYLP